MKKRIFISVHAMKIGGVESSLIGLLQSIDYARFDVDVFVFSHTGEFMDLIPKQVNLLPEKRTYKLALGDFKASMKAGCWRLAIAQFVAKLRFWLYVQIRKPINFDAYYSYMGRCLSPVLPDVGEGEYDLALSFLDPHNFVLDHVKAKKKLGWIHADYTSIDVNKRLETPIWGALDRIVGVSDSVCQQFAEAFPTLRDKLVTIENILSPAFVRQRAEGPVPEEFSSCLEAGMPILCSMGRICDQKNFANIPYMAKELTAMNKKFHWFILGPGDAEQIMKVAGELGVAKCVSFIGPRSNPYPYVKHCDFYLQPSVFEGKSVAVREAQMLGKPVIITNYSTAPSQVRDGVDGVIVHLDNKAIAEGVAALMDDPARQKRICDYLATHDYGNVHEIEKIYALMDEA